MIDAALIYEAQIWFTSVIDFGLSMEDLSSGKVPIAPAGARFDQTFAWLDGLRLWAVGTLDPARGEALVRAYAT